MPEFPANSHAAKDPHPTKGEPPKQEDKKIEKVVTGAVVRRKKPIGRRLIETFVGGDSKTAVQYVLMEVLVPAAKDMLTDAISQGVERLVYGEARSSSRRTGARPSGSSYVNYNRYASSSNPPFRPDPREPARTISARARASHSFEDIVLATRAEAEEVIDRLFELSEKYGQATVGDLYELVGITGNYTDDRWGWNDLRGSGVTRVRNGYLLDIQKPEPLE
jgi:hypothetical protein